MVEEDENWMVTEEPELNIVVPHETKNLDPITSEKNDPPLEEKLRISLSDFYENNLS